MECYQCGDHFQFNELVREVEDDPHSELICSNCVEENEQEDL